MNLIAAWFRVLIARSGKGRAGLIEMEGPLLSLATLLCAFSKKGKTGRLCWRAAWRWASNRLWRSVVVPVPSVVGWHFKSYRLGVSVSALPLCD